MILNSLVLPRRQLLIQALYDKTIQGIDSLLMLIEMLSPQSNASFWAR